MARYYCDTRCGDVNVWNFAPFPIQHVNSAVTLSDLCCWPQQQSVNDISHYVNVYDDIGRLRVNQASAAGVLLKHRRARTETYHSSFFIRIVDIWNNLPPTSRNNCTCLFSFKKLIEMFYQETLLTFSTDDVCSWLSFCRCESCKCIRLNVLILHISLFDELHIIIAYCLCCIMPC